MECLHCELKAFSDCAYIYMHKVVKGLRHRKMLMMLFVIWSEFKTLLHHNYFYWLNLYSKCISSLANSGLEAPVIQFGGPMYNLRAK